MTDATRLKGLHLWSGYGDKGYRVTADFEGPVGEVKLNLPASLSARVVDVCLDEIVSAIRSAADVSRESLLRGEAVARKEIEHDGDA